MIFLEYEIDSWAINFFELWLKFDFIQFLFEKKL